MIMPMALTLINPHLQPENGKLKTQENINPHIINNDKF